MHHIPIQILQSQSAIILPAIQDGFDNYPHILLQKTPEEYLALLHQLVELNGVSHSFADCYFGKLPDEKKSGLLSFLPNDWQNILLQCQFTDDSVFLSFDDIADPIIDILAYLSAKEFLFSTFYFTKYPCTVWTNYNLTYPIFFRDKEMLFYYQGIL